MKKLQKMQNFWRQWKGWDFFGLQLPSLIALSLFIFLLIHMSFEIYRIVGVAMRIKCVGHPTAMECGRDSLLGIALTILENTIVVVGSDTVRNLSLLLAASIGWFFLYWRANTADLNAEAVEQSANATRKNAEIAEKGLAVERFTRAVEQIANQDLSVRLGGVLGLEQIAYTQDEGETIKIARILATFIRAQAGKNSERTEKDIATYNRSKPEIIDDFSIYRAQRLDIEAAVHALANIALIMLEEYFEQEDSKPKRDLCDLRNTDLRGLHFNEIDLSNFNLRGIDFSYANLMKTNFTRATIGNIINFEKENMTKFIRAYLTGAIFNDALVFSTDFSSSNLTYATFDGAHLMGAILDECCINRTHFETSKDLTQSQINKAFYWDNDLPPFLPEGFNPPQWRPSPIPVPIDVESNNSSTKNNEQNT